MTPAPPHWLREGRSFAALRPAGLGDAARLVVAALRFAPIRIRGPQSRHLGHLLYGSTPLEFRVDRLNFFVRPGTDDLDYLLPTHKPAVSAWFRPRAAETVLDVGAHLGYFALRAARAGARVVAVEPNPGTLELLRREIERNRLSSIEVDSRMVATGPTLSYLYESPQFPGMSSIDPSWLGDAQLSPPARLPVRSVPLDQLCREYGIARVDWLLIDVEGAELGVVETGPEILRATQRVIVEVSRASGEPLEAALTRLGLVCARRMFQSSRTEYRLYRRVEGPIGLDGARLG